jgi:hypothetical protein
MMAVECGWCPAQIEWAFTMRGKRIPIDALPDENGNLAVRRTESGRLLSRMLTTDSPLRPDERRAMPHHATCSGNPKNRKAI